MQTQVKMTSTIHIEAGAYKVFLIEMVIEANSIKITTGLKEQMQSPTLNCAATVKLTSLSDLSLIMSELFNWRDVKVSIYSVKTCKAKVKDMVFQACQHMANLAN